MLTTPRLKKGTFVPTSRLRLVGVALAGGAWLGLMPAYATLQHEGLWLAIDLIVQGLVLPIIIGEAFFFFKERERAEGKKQINIVDKWFFTLGMALALLAGAWALKAELTLLVLAYYGWGALLAFHIEKKKLYETALGCFSLMVLLAVVMTS